MKPQTGMSFEVGQEVYFFSYTGLLKTRYEGFIVGNSSIGNLFWVASASEVPCFNVSRFYSRERIKRSINLYNFHPQILLLAQQFYVYLIFKSNIFLNQKDMPICQV